VPVLQAPAKIEIEHEFDVLAGLDAELLGNLEPLSGSRTHAHAVPSAGIAPVDVRVLQVHLEPHPVVLACGEFVVSDEALCDTVLQLHHVDIQRAAGHLDRENSAVTVMKLHRGDVQHHRLGIVPRVVGD
jgi:hypothetical protein